MDSSLHPDVDVLDRPYCHLHDRPLTVDAALLTELMGHPTYLWISLIGYPEAVNREILSLHPCGYDIEAWSLPQRIPGTAEVITSYAKQSYRSS
ncbi:MAG: hypothetical protein VKJ24_04855 [Synechococcales bacterium]|nr:hypothetical protein [Synechococcales bacterium]